MPPAAKKRRTSGPAAAAAQGTLAFKSSKAAASQGSPYFKAAKPFSKLPTKSEVVDITTDESQSQTQQPPALHIDDPSARILETADDVEEPDEAAEAQAAEDRAIEKKALGLADSKLRAYWVAKEKERKAPRVHQKELTMREKMLREWDMSSRYGVCQTDVALRLLANLLQPSIGITRIARWKRAHRLGMEPPIEILAVLLKEEQSAKDKGDKLAELQIQKSIMDDLIMSSRLRGEIEA
jgi:DNA polymerase delta subunit 4